MHPLSQDREVVVDDLQGVVDLVGDPRGQQPHRGELLGEEDLLLHPVVVGDILHQEDAADVLPLVQHGQGAQVVEGRGAPSRRIVTLKNSRSSPLCSAPSEVGMLRLAHLRGGAAAEPDPGTPPRTARTRSGSARSRASPGR